MTILNPAELASQPSDAPMDQSDDYAYDLFGTFYTNPGDFNDLATKLAVGEYLFRLEVAARLIWHVNAGINSQISQNAPLGLDSETVREHFWRSSTDALRAEASNWGDAQEAALVEIAEAFKAPNKATAGPLNIFGVDDTDKLYSRIEVLAGLVAVMRSSLGALEV